MSVYSSSQSRPASDAASYQHKKIKTLPVCNSTFPYMLHKHRPRFTRPCLRWGTLQVVIAFLLQEISVLPFSEVKAENLCPSALQIIWAPGWSIVNPLVLLPISALSLLASDTWLALLSVSHNTGNGRSPAWLVHWQALCIRFARLRHSFLCWFLTGTSSHSAK